MFYRVFHFQCYTVNQFSIDLQNSKNANRNQKTFEIWKIKYRNFTNNLKKFLDNKDQVHEVKNYFNTPINSYLGNENVDQLSKMFEKGKVKTKIAFQKQI